MPLQLKAEVPVDLATIVGGRTVVHELALQGDEDLCVGDHVALATDSVTLVALITAIDDDGYLHFAIR